MDPKTVRKYLAPIAADGLVPGGPPVMTEADRLARAQSWFPALVDIGLRQVTWPAISAHRDYITHLRPPLPPSPRPEIRHPELRHLCGEDGDTISSVNQSAQAAVARLMHDRYPPMAVVVLAGLCAIAIAAVAARKQLARRNELAALACIAIGGLLASPASWSHHYVWSAPALIILFLEKHTVAAALGAASFYVAPLQNIPFDDGVEPTYGPSELFVSAAYTLAAIVSLASRFFTRSSPASPTQESKPQSA